MRKSDEKKLHRETTFNQKLQYLCCTNPPFTYTVCVRVGHHGANCFVLKKQLSINCSVFLFFF